MLALRSKIQSIIKEELIKLLNERTYNINDDVDLLYDKYFRDDINQIKQTGIITIDMFKEGETDTSIFKSSECIQANDVNPCRLIINRSSNYYNFSKNLISVGIHLNALDLILYQYNGDIDKAERSDSYNKNIHSEFTEVRIKGAIYHELTHWLDQTFNDNSIARAVKLKNAREESYNKNSININTHYIEVNAQIHSIKQAKRIYEKTWDLLTIYDLFKIIPSLGSIYRSMKDENQIKWLKNLKKRMYREGLLGKKMYN